MRIVREAFERARSDAGRIDDAIAVAEGFLSRSAGHPVALAYLGSLNGMKAGASVLPWVKLRHANIASALLDEAHARRLEAATAGEDEYPGDLVILLLRGIAYASFPPFLGRGEAARASLEEAVSHAAFTGVPIAYRALALAHLGAISAGTDRRDGMQQVPAEVRELDAAGPARSRGEE